MARRKKVDFCKKCKDNKLLHLNGLCKDCNAWKKSSETNYVKWFLRRKKKLK